jgi:hypothetical protein
MKGKYLLHCLIIVESTHAKKSTLRAKLQDHQHQDQNELQNQDKTQE